jgi:glycerol-3-phosphate acyltransferase PlsX
MLAQMPTANLKYWNNEGRDLFNDKADVIVCDGFTGNVILKMAESFYDILKEKNISDPFIDRLDYEAVGGTPILGINGNAIIGHGASSPGAICNMLKQAYQMASSDVSEKFKKTYSA